MHTQPFFGSLSRSTRVCQYLKKHSSTHTPPHLPRTIASSWQSLCTTSNHVLWPTSGSGAYFILHTLLHPIIIILSHTCPYHRNLFCCSSDIMSTIPCVSLNSLFETPIFQLPNVTEITSVLYHFRH